MTEGPDIETFSLRTDAFHRDPFPVYRILRDEHPVFFDPSREAYGLSRYADVAWAARMPAIFGQDPGPDVYDRMTRMDPPRHGEWRALTAPRFQKRVVATIEDHVRTVAEELVLGMPAHGDGVDVVTHFSGRLPSRVIGHLLGIPPEHNERFQELAPVCIAGPPDAADAANHEIYGIVDEVIQARRRAPREDLVSLLLAGSVGGAPLTRRELLGYCLHLVVAGNDTTTNLISTGVRLLGERPDVRAALLDDPSLIPKAIEEMLRWDGPAQMLPRRTHAPVELHGVTIPAGSFVELYWGAANRDERRFATPDTFDLHRTDQGPHLAFGQGIHFCLGAHLARLEARVAFEELLRLIPDFGLPDQEFPLKPGWAVRGYERVLIDVR